MKDREKIKTAIIVLSILLAISLLAIGGILIYKHYLRGQNGLATVPDNVITSDTRPDESQAGEGVTGAVGKATDQNANLGATDISLHYSNAAGVPKTGDAGMLCLGVCIASGLLLMLLLLKKQEGGHCQ